MAPEVLSEKEYNEKCDIWSTGIMMYLLLAGIPPFYSNDKDTTIKLIIEGKVEFNSNFNIYLSFYRSFVE